MNSNTTRPGSAHCLLTVARYSGQISVLTDYGFAKFQYFLQLVLSERGLQIFFLHVAIMLLPVSVCLVVGWDSGSVGHFILSFCGVVCFFVSGVVCFFVMNED